jgi:hypothetical protein
MEDLSEKSGGRVAADHAVLVVQRDQHFSAPSIPPSCTKDWRFPVVAPLIWSRASFRRGVLMARWAWRTGSVSLDTMF